MAESTFQEYNSRLLHHYSPEILFNKQTIRDHAAFPRQGETKVKEIYPMPSSCIALTEQSLRRLFPPANYMFNNVNSSLTPFLEPFQYLRRNRVFIIKLYLSTEPFKFRIGSDDCICIFLKRKRKIDTVKYIMP